MSVVRSGGIQNVLSERLEGRANRIYQWIRLKVVRKGPMADSKASAWTTKEGWHCCQHRWTSVPVKCLSSGGGAGSEDTFLPGAPALPLQKPLLLKGGGGAPTELTLVITTY